MNTFFLSVISALVVIAFNILQIRNHPNKILKGICFILFLFTGLRYITLIVFTLSTNINILKLFSHFYFASSIGITIPSALALWYIIPRFREKIREWMVLILLSPFIIFYLRFIYLQPTQILKKAGLGYRLQITSPWTNYLNVAQGIFAIIIIGICILASNWYRYKFPRSQYLLFILGYILTFIDGLSVIFNRVYPIEPFILSETFILVAILYAFSTKPIKEQYRS